MISQWRTLLRRASHRVFYWRRNLFRRYLRRFRTVLARSGPAARRVHYPVPLRLPTRARSVALCRDRGLGDVLMCTPAMRELKRRNPSCRIRFYTDFPSLLDGLPYIDEVRPFDERPFYATYLDYETALPPQVHLSKIIGDKVGVEVTDIRPDCIVPDGLVESWKARWAALPRPHIVVVRTASAWTPNKDWPAELWDSALDLLTQLGTVIELGTTAELPQRAIEGSYVDLRGRTTLDEFVAAIAAADLYVGPVSAPLHIAAAVGKPSVVIYGGYEHPVNSSYPQNVDLYTDLPCSPCWLMTPCPYEKKCLTAITPERVVEAVRSLVSAPARTVSRLASVSRIP